MPKLKIKTIALPAFEGKTLQDVYNYLKREFPQALPFDGVDFYDNDCLKDGMYHYFFGSVFRGAGGDCIPGIQWNDFEFDRGSSFLDGGWDGDFRVVLLDPSEIVKTTQYVVSNATLESLDKRVKKLEKKIK